MFTLAVNIVYSIYFIYIAYSNFNKTIFSLFNRESRFESKDLLQNGTK